MTLDGCQVASSPPPPPTTAPAQTTRRRRLFDKAAEAWASAADALDKSLVQWAPVALELSARAWMAAGAYANGALGMEQAAAKWAAGFARQSTFDAWNKAAVAWDAAGKPDQRRRRPADGELLVERELSWNASSSRGTRAPRGTPQWRLVERRSQLERQLLVERRRLQRLLLVERELELERRSSWNATSSGTPPAAGTPARRGTAAGGDGGWNSTADWNSSGEQADDMDRERRGAPACGQARSERPDLARRLGGNSIIALTAVTTWHAVSTRPWTFLAFCGLTLVLQLVSVEVYNRGSSSFASVGPARDRVRVRPRPGDGRPPRSWVRRSSSRGAGG